MKVFAGDAQRYRPRRVEFGWVRFASCRHRFSAATLRHSASASTTVSASPHDAVTSICEACSLPVSPNASCLSGGRVLGCAGRREETQMLMQRSAAQLPSADERDRTRTRRRRRCRFAFRSVIEDTIRHHVQSVACDFMTVRADTSRTQEIQTAATCVRAGTAHPS